MNIQESGQMYLETILVLSREKANVRSIDVVNHTGYSKPSVSRAMGILKNGGMISIDPDGYIHLTDEGQRVAEEVYARHTILAKALMLVGVSKETAEEDACRIEHYISSETVECLKRFIENK
ncbi:MAG: metal-dependent transcriptional regulator [Clostridia bacterium]|nr:metal-dependent transcriptional regulator [Clostridia bacterium]